MDAEEDVLAGKAKKKKAANMKDSVDNEDKVLRKLREKVEKFSIAEDSGKEPGTNVVMNVSLDRIKDIIVEVIDRKMGAQMKISVVKVTDDSTLKVEVKMGKKLVLFFIISRVIQEVVKAEEDVKFYYEKDLSYCELKNMMMISPKSFEHLIVFLRTDCIKLKELTCEEFDCRSLMKMGRRIGRRLVLPFVSDEEYEDIGTAKQYNWSRPLRGERKVRKEALEESDKALVDKYAKLKISQQRLAAAEKTFSTPSFDMDRFNSQGKRFSNKSGKEWT